MISKKVHNSVLHNIKHGLPDIELFQTVRSQYYYSLKNSKKDPDIMPINESEECFIHHVEHIPDIDF